MEVSEIADRLILAWLKGDHGALDAARKELAALDEGQRDEFIRYGKRHADRYGLLGDQRHLAAIWDWVLREARSTAGP